MFFLFFLKLENIYNEESPNGQKCLQCSPFRLTQTSFHDRPVEGSSLLPSLTSFHQWAAVMHNEPVVGTE